MWNQLVSLEPCAAGSGSAYWHGQQNLMGTWDLCILGLNIVKHQKVDTMDDGHSSAIRQPQESRTPVCKENDAIGDISLCPLRSSLQPAVKATVL